MKVILFGVGAYFNNYQKIVFSLPDMEIAGIIDNDAGKQGNIVNGYQVYAPEAVHALDYDYVVIMSIHAMEIEKQLLSYGISSNKILRFEEWAGAAYGGKYERFPGKSKEKGKKKILLMTHSVGNNGSCIALLYMALTLKEMGYEIGVASGIVDKSYIHKFTDSGIDVWSCPNLKFVEGDRIPWIYEYDYVILNTLLMWPCLRHITFRNHVIWWIHEGRHAYRNEYSKWGRLSDDIFQACNVYCVSGIAESFFKEYYPNVETGVLEYGIPDIAFCEDGYGKNEKFVFTINGYIGEPKGQHLFVEAIECLSAEEVEKCEFWIIGKVSDDAYCNKVFEKAAKMPQIKIWGEMEHEKLLELLSRSDVLVCASTDDPLPLTVTEALRCGKACIISDTTGTAAYLEDGTEALIFRSGDKEALSDRMRAVLTGAVDIYGMGKASRKKFMETFSIDSLCKRIREALASLPEQ